MRCISLPSMPIRRAIPYAILAAAAVLGVLRGIQQDSPVLVVTTLVLAVGALLLARKRANESEDAKQKTRIAELHKRVKLTTAPAGFSAANVPPGHYGFVCVRAKLTSDDPMFHTYMDGVAGMALNQFDMIPYSQIVNFLIVAHPDLSADIYVNHSLPVRMELLAKQSVQGGERVYDKDIADIRRVEFPGVPIDKDDSVLCCLKIGWKFGMFFDFRHGNELDIDQMALDLGTLYRHLTFEHVYKSLQSKYFDQMLEDGWFPFVEIAGRDYKDLAQAYEADLGIDGRTQDVVERFTDERVKAMLTRWADREPFKSKKAMLKAGVDAYLQRTAEGYINCIKTLGTEVEGLLREIYARDQQEVSGRLKTLIGHIVKKGEDRSGQESLLLPREFLRYLHDVLFRDFNVETGDVELSRNSASHGVAEADDYTQARALQIILAIDQIWFYTGEDGAGSVSPASS